MQPDFVPRSAVPARARRRRGASEPTRAERDQPHLRALPPGAVLALRRTPGRAARRGGRSPTGRQPHHLGRGARLPARRLRARRWLHRPATIRTARIARDKLERAGDARRQRRLHDAATRATPRPRRCARTRTTIRRARAARASPATCRARTWGSATRSRAITASARPTEPRASSGDRPLECALCHADRSVASAGRRHGAPVGQALRSRRAARALRRRSRRERRCSPRSRAASRTSRRRRWRCSARARARGAGADRAPAREPDTRSCATTRGARSTRSAARRARSISIARRRRSRRRRGGACRVRGRGRRRHRRQRIVRERRPTRPTTTDLARTGSASPAGGPPSPPGPPDTFYDKLKRYGIS